ncbi:hypothetical protein [Dactylosporangium darangshiense]|uniref:Lipoprotein n=1 Tax=Dactylosporangium darangshiense TaxID=579108 RepID=A0ABP8D3U3_9ACTN
MKIAKGVVAVIVAVTSLLLVTACSGKDKAASSGGPSGAPAGTAAAPAKSAGAVEQLAAAAAKTGGGTYTFKVTSANATVDGAADPAGPTSTGKLVVTVDKTKVTFETLFTAGTYLVKISGLSVPGLDGRKWLRLDRTKLTGDDLLDAASVKDPTGLSDFPATVAEAGTADGRLFKGTLDLTKSSFTLVDDAAVKGLGDLAKVVPYEATVDEKGYLTSLKVNVPAYAQTKADQVTVTYAGFGAPLQAPSPSTSEVIDAPAAAYRLLNGQ